MKTDEFRFMQSQTKEIWSDQKLEEPTYIPEPSEEGDQLPWH